MDPIRAHRIYCSPDGFGGIQAGAGFSGLAGATFTLTPSMSGTSPQALPWLKVPVVLSPRCKIQLYAEQSNPPKISGLIAGSSLLKMI